MPASSRNTSQFLVASRVPGHAGEQELQRFVERVKATEGATLMRQVGEPVPRRCVVAMPLDVAKTLQQEFGHSLIIEGDAPLGY